MTRLLPALFAALFALPAAASDKPFERPVVVRVDVDPSGSVVGADAVGDLPDGSVDMDRSGLAAISLWKGGRKLEQSQVYRDEYVAEVMKVMRHWKPMIEEVEGAPVATSWHVPVTFCPPDRKSVCDKIKADAPASSGRKADDSGIRLASLKQPETQDAGP